MVQFYYSILNVPYAKLGRRFLSTQWREDVEGGRRRVRDNDDDEQLREWTYGQTNAEEFENTRRRRREQREGKRNDTK